MVIYIVSNDIELLFKSFQQYSANRVKFDF